MSKAKDSNLLLELRNAVADYMRSEGCSCCEDTPRHLKHKARLATLLKVSAYPDGSGFDFAPYETKKK